MIGMIWAVLFDWLDGIVARKMTRRSATDSTFGGQLDILIDIISYGIAPSILLLSYGNFKPFFLIAVFIALSASALRLSYFSTFGLADGKRYIGLALHHLEFSSVPRNRLRRGLVSSRDYQVFVAVA